MAQIIKLRRSSVAGNVPTSTQLGLGELAINTSDGKIFFEKNDGSATVQTIVTTNTNAPITGSLSLSGSMHLTGSQYISDGSMLPSAPGVNPQGTIMAFAHRNIEKIIAET